MIRQTPTSPWTRTSTCPGPTRVAQWWQGQQQSLQPGTGYLLGQPFSEQQCTAVLYCGTQGQRRAAASLLARYQPTRLLLATDAPASRRVGKSDCLAAESGHRRHKESANMLKKSLQCPSLYSVTDPNHAANVPVQTELATIQDARQHWQPTSRMPAFRNLQARTRLPMNTPRHIVPCGLCPSTNQIHSTRE